MPFIHIKSLPFQPPLDVRDILRGVTEEFAHKTGVGSEHITATWEHFQPGHYTVAGHAGEHQAADFHPVIVDLLVPDSNDSETIETMLLAIAQALSQRAGLAPSNVFINCRRAHSGWVFDSGKVVRW